MSDKNLIRRECIPNPVEGQQFGDKSCGGPRCPACAADRRDAVEDMRNQQREDRLEKYLLGGR